MKNENCEMREYVSFFEMFKDDLNEMPESENRIDRRCKEPLEKRIDIVGEKYENEMAIIDRGGLNHEVPLGEYDRVYSDAWALSMKKDGNDSHLDLDWQNFDEFFLEICLLKRIHEDFQFPLVWYLENVHGDDRLRDQIEWIKSDDYETFVSLPFSDEMKENWEPLVKLLSH